MIRPSFRSCGARHARRDFSCYGDFRSPKDGYALNDGEFVVHNFKFHYGESLPDVRLHYTTLGKPARDAQDRTTNAVVPVYRCQIPTKRAGN